MSVFLLTKRIKYRTKKHTEIRRGGIYLTHYYTSRCGMEDIAYGEFPDENKAIEWAKNKGVTHFVLSTDNRAKSIGSVYLIRVRL